MEGRTSSDAEMRSGCCGDNLQLHHKFEVEGSRRKSTFHCLDRCSLTFTWERSSRGSAICGVSRISADLVVRSAILAIVS